MAKKEISHAGSTVQLADSDTSFFDHETGFKLVRDGKEKLGDNVGKKTASAILSGRLLVVSGKLQPDETAAPKTAAPKASAKKAAATEDK